MQVHALQFHGLTIQQETAIGIKLDITDTCRRQVTVHHLAILCDDGLHLIEIGVGGAPEMRLPDDELLFAACRLLRLQQERLRDGLPHLLTLGIEQTLRHATLAGLQSVVLHLCLHHDLCQGIGPLQFGIDKRAEGCHTHQGLLLKPHIAVDAGSLVEPSFLERGIGTDTDQVVLAIFDIRCDVVDLRGIATRLRTHIEAVEPHLGISEDTVEAQFQLFAEILLTDLHQFTIPAHTRRGILPAYGLVTVRVTGLGGIGQGGHPVVRHLHLLPACIIKLGGIRSLVVDRVRFRQIVKVLGATAEVLLRICCMPQFELPALVEADGLTYTLRIGYCDQQATHRCHNHCLKRLHHHDSFQFLTANIRRFFLIFNRLHNFFFSAVIKVSRFGAKRTYPTPGRGPGMRYAINELLTINASGDSGEPEASGRRWPSSAGP